MTSSKTLSEHSDNSIAIQRSTDIMPLQVKSTNTLPPHRLANHLAREQFYNGIHNVPSQSLQQQHQQYLQQRALDAEGNWWVQKWLLRFLHRFLHGALLVLAECSPHHQEYTLFPNARNSLSLAVLCHRMVVQWIEHHFIGVNWAGEILTI